MRSLIIIFLFICSGIKAQYLISSNTSVESCNDMEGCLTVNNLSYLYYDESKNEFFLKLTFSDFRNEETDTIDNWLNREKDSSFYFKAILPKEQFPALSNENTKTYKLNGRIFYNNVWKDQVIELTIYTTENSLLSTTGVNSNLKYDAYKVNFNIPFVPGDFKKYDLLYYDDQTVNINVTLGRINLLKPGMEFLLNEAYYSMAR